MTTRIQWEKVGEQLTQIGDRYREAEKRYYAGSADDHASEARRLAFDLRFIQVTAASLADRIEKGAG